MRHIGLHSVRMQHFKSFIDHEVKLSHTPGFKFMSGANKAEPALGANGAGKSTLWDAIFWCLFGVSAKGLRASELVTWGEKKTRVVVHISIDGIGEVICRESNPERIYLGDAESDVPADSVQRVEQKDIDRILGLTLTRFRHSVIFGQGNKLFPDLAVPERADLLEDVLNLGLWARLADRSSRYAAKLAGDIVGVDLQIAKAEGALETLDNSDIERLMAAEREWEHNQSTTRAEYSEKLKVLCDKFTKVETQKGIIELSLKDAIEARKDAQDDTDKLSARRQKLVIKKNQARVKADDLFKHMRFYEKHEECPTCEQTIGPKLRKTKTLTCVEEMAGEEEREAWFGNKIAALDKEIATATTIWRTLDTVVNQTVGTKAVNRERIERLNYEIQTVTQQLAHLDKRNARNPHTEQIDRMKAQRKAATKALTSYNRAKMKSQKAQAVNDYWLKGWKKLRLKRMERTLAFLQLETANATEALGLSGWKVKYVTEVETKSGNPKLGVQIMVTSPKATGTWEGWSGGEAQRLRVAIAWGLAKMIQGLSGVSYGWEVWDEPSAWLSSEGIEDLLEALSDRALRNECAIYLCDHRALTYSGFSEIWQVTKTHKGSEVTKL